MNTLSLFIPNISCNHCTMSIKNALSEIEGVDDVEADANTKKVSVDYIEPANEQIIIKTLEAIDYPPER